MKMLLEYLGKVLKLFKSVKMSAVVIALLILIYFLGLVLPQKWMFLSEAHYDQWVNKNFLNSLMDFTGFTDIYLSPVTVFLLALFFINLVVVIVNRMPVMLKRMYLGGERPAFGVDDLKRTGAESIEVASTGDNLYQKLNEFFRKRRWQTIDSMKQNTFIAIKNRFSPIGFMLFHVSFLLCLIGGLLITYTRFSGELALTEGEEFRGDIKQFRTVLKDAKIMKELPPLLMYIDKVEPMYVNNVPVELLVRLKISYKDQLDDALLKVNEPVKRGPLSIIAQRIGVSPLFIIKGPGGRELEGAYVSLNVMDGEEDSFVFETDNSIKFNVKFYPDHYIENGEDASRSIELKNPAMHLSVEKDGKVINESLIKKGEFIPLGMHTRIGFKEIRYWAEFMIVREYGTWPLIAGFIFASAGLVMRLVFYQRRIRVAIEYDGKRSIIYMDGKSEYFRHSFKEEFEKSLNDLEDFFENSKIHATHNSIEVT